MQVEKVLGIDTPAYKAGLKSGDVLVEVQGELITMMTHPQVTLFMYLVTLEKQTFTFIQN